MKIDNKTLGLLHKYLQNDGDASTDGFKKFLGTKSDNSVRSYQEALVQTYPDVYDDDEEEEKTEEEPSLTTHTQTDKSTKAPTCPDEDCCRDKKVLLHNDETGVATELELKTTTKKAVVYVLKEPKDEVDIRVAGEDLTVDLIKLKKMDKDAVLGDHKVSTLILAAELAKV